MSGHASEPVKVMEEKKREKRIAKLIKLREEADAILEEVNYHKIKRPKHNNRPWYESESPLSKAIRKAPPPNLTIPDLEYYDGEGDPVRHVSNLETLVRMSGFGDADLCRIFSASFTHSARQWFGNLKAGSISSFPQFKEQFLIRFRDYPKKSTFYLTNIKQGPEESLRSYMKRWKDATHEIAHMNTTEAKWYLYTGVNQQSNYFRMLMSDDPETLDEMYVIADRCIAMEDALGDRRNWDNRKRWRKRKN